MINTEVLKVNGVHFRPTEAAAKVLLHVAVVEGRKNAQAVNQILERFGRAQGILAPLPTTLEATSANANKEPA